MPSGPASSNTLTFSLCRPTLLTTPACWLVHWIQANKLLDHPDGYSGWGIRLKTRLVHCQLQLCVWRDVCSHFVSPEAISSSWLQADMKWKKTIPCAFPWSHFTSTYNLFRGKKKKATAAAPFVSPSSPSEALRKGSKLEQRGNGDQHRKINLLI